MWYTFCKKYTENCISEFDIRRPDLLVVVHRWGLLLIQVVGEHTTGLQNKNSLLTNVTTSLIDHNPGPNCFSFTISRTLSRTLPGIPTSSISLRFPSPITLSLLWCLWAALWATRHGPKSQITALERLSNGSGRVSVHGP